MAFVDLTQLTQEEDWAVRYARKIRNQQIVIQNAQATAYNASRPVNSPEQPIQDLYTVQSMADELVRTSGIQSAVQQMRSAKQQVNVPAYLAAPFEVQQQVDALLGVAPLLDADDLT